jgi:hypothetical protein
MQTIDGSLGKIGRTDQRKRNVAWGFRQKAYSGSCRAPVAFHQGTSSLELHALAPAAALGRHRDPLITHLHRVHFRLLTLG